jgi:hypothetical protein
VRRVESSRCRWDLSLPIRLRCTVRPDSESSHASFLVVTAGALGTDVVLMALRMEKESNNLQKDAKTYLDSMRGENEAVLTGPAMHPYPIPSASRLSRLCDPPPAHSRSPETIALFYTADRASDVSSAWRCIDRATDEVWSIRADRAAGRNGRTRLQGGG